MAYVAVDENGDEVKFIYKPIRDRGEWCFGAQHEYNDAEELPKGSIKKLIGRELTWEDEPVELKDA